MDFNNFEVRNKLREIILGMLLDAKMDCAMPQEICEGILEMYGWSSLKKLNYHEDLSRFAIALLKWIEEKPTLSNTAEKKHFQEQEPDSDAIYKKYLKAEFEYCQVSSELIKTLEEAFRHKEKYCQNFRNKCKSEEKKMKILKMKCQFLKLQFFLKLYSEEKALKGHLELQSKLTQELEVLKKKYIESQQLNKQYNIIVKDKNFLELFKIYQELKKIEKRTEIIGNM